MSAMPDVFLCGGDCVEDVNRSECHLRESPEVRIPMDHTIGRAIKELSHENLEYRSSSGNVFRFNTNPRLNDLLMKLNMKMGLFKSGQIVNVDFDHVFVKTEKADAKYSYKRKRIRDAAFFFIIMLVTFAATLLKPQNYVSSRTIQKCVEHVSTST